MSEAPVIHMRENDDLPSLSFVVETEDGKAVDLSGFRAYLMLRRTDGRDPFLEDGTAPYWIRETLIANPAVGVVTHDWQPDETLWPGIYSVAVQCNNSAGRGFTAPTDGQAQIIVGSGALPPDGGGYGLGDYGSGTYGNP